LLLNQAAKANSAATVIVLLAGRSYAEFSSP
jgi:hypothetical protein